MRGTLAVSCRGVLLRLHAGHAVSAVLKAPAPPAAAAAAAAVTAVAVAAAGPAAEKGDAAW
jgi:hypothetical protein